LPPEGGPPGGNFAAGLKDSFGQGGPRMKRHWNATLQSLVLVRMGQELGTDSDLAQAVAHSIDFVLGTLARFLS